MRSLVPCHLSHSFRMCQLFYIPLMLLCLFHPLFHVHGGGIEISRKTSPPFSKRIKYMNSPCNVSHSASDTIADCRALNIAALSSLMVPMETRVILLDYNCFSSLTRDFLRGRSDLRVLSISHGELNKIEHDAFQDVTNLEYLNLENNRLAYSGCDVDKPAISRAVFAPLVKLEYLLLRGNDFGCLFEVPENQTDVNNVISNHFLQHDNDTTFSASNTLSETDLEFLTEDSELPLLTTFSLDIHDFIDSNKRYHTFKNLMPNLTTLDVNSVTGKISRDYFKAFRGLEVKKCSIEAKQLRNFHSQALLPLRHLESFTLFNSIIGLNNAVLSLSPFSQRKLREVRFDNVNYGQPDIAWGKENREYDALTSVCIERLSLRYNRIHKFDIGPESSTSRLLLLSCAKYLDLSDNIKGLFSVPPADYVGLQGIDISIWKSLEELKIVNLQDMFPDIPVFDKLMEEKPSLLPEYSEKMGTKNSCKQYFNMSLTYTLSENLLVFNRSNSSEVYPDMQFGEIVFDNATNLTDLDLSGSGFFKMPAVFRGLDNLERFYFSRNNISELSERVFDKLPSLQLVDLSYCQMSSKFLFGLGQRLFRHLKSLQSINLSHNGLEALSADIFAYNKELRIISLKGNRLASLSVELSNTPLLKELDMRANNIKQFTVHERNQIDKFSLTQRDFKVYIQENSFSCTCEDVSFLLWLRLTRVTLDEDRNYTCLWLEERQFLSPLPHVKDIRALWRRCVGKTYLLLSLMTATLFLTGFLLVILVSRHKRYIKAFAMKVFLHDFQLKTRADYNIGVFIGYAEEDYQFPCLVPRAFIEDELGLTCYVRDRDQIPNQPMANSIAEAINSSWKTLLVVTPRFLISDEWGHFTAKMSVYAQGPENPHRLMILVDQVTVDSLPTDLLCAVSDDNIICLPRLSMCYELRQKLRTRLLN
ncbi:toll-like receptor 4 [Aplysia californica]|uniref:Toll-like receptor 4 n=1 Tax=Aplysia californica TaxID=6500 RepID=A0ABM1A2C8_APLCA|nr:toll-like receptor 4 [Aplysia californica]